jgi:hypothetical protein
MLRRFRMVTYLLVGILALASPAAHAAAGRIATQADLDGAIAKSLSDDAAARQAITSLLQREDVRDFAKAQGLDVRKAEAAVGTLEGQELQNLSSLAAHAQTQLAGGDEVIRISLVALLLIIIIIILLVD